ncbi:MAG: glycine zipper 2TM domain-containing protein [Rhodocyclaceae bacterium]|nr:glycine zipper 2TM domain-containing protein [Rhodocyclaceae bacterium]
MQQSAPRPGLHPLVWVAAVSVTLFSLVGIAAIMGLIPTSSSKSADQVPAQLTEAAPPAAAQVPRPPQSAAAPVVTAPVATAHPKPVHKEPQRIAAAEPARNAPPPPAAICMDCGTIAGIRTVEHAGNASGVGAVAGGVVGALLGNAIGNGRGRTVTTIAGAAGGAYAGNQIEKSRNKTLRYEISVRMDDGSTRTLSQDSAPTWREGDRVRIENGVLRTNG